MPKLLFSANAPWAKTGYGVQGQHLLPRFQALGWDVAYFAWYGLQGGMMEADGIRIYPGGARLYGNDIAPAHAKHFEADLLITLIDLWVLDPKLGMRCTLDADHWVPWLAWFPIDHSPPMPDLLERMRVCDYPVQYSQFGLAAAREAGSVPCRYIPHGVAPEIFRPGDQAAARRALGLPESAFLCAIVAANKGYPSRKAFPEQLQAFAQFRQRHPEAVLYIWSQTLDTLGGVNLPLLCHSLGLPEKAVFHVNAYRQHLGIPDTELATLYQAADVLLSASYAEGFGVPILEAQACGTPVITTQGTAMTELTVNGIAVPPRQKWWNQLDYRLCNWQDVPDVPGILEALESVYHWATEKRQALSAEGVRWAHEGYSWDVCVRDYWAPLMAEIELMLQQRRECERLVRQYLSTPVEGVTPAYQARYEAIAQRDHSQPASAVNDWLVLHRLSTALGLLAADRRPVGRCVDLGAAEGQFGVQLERWGADSGATHYTPVELVGSRVTLGRRAHPHWAWRQAAAETFGTPGQADTVVCLELIEHVPDPAALLANCARLLVPGGRLLLATPNDPEGEFVDGEEHVRGYDWGSLSAVLREAGFEPIACTTTIPNLYGPAGLVNQPHRLPEYHERAARRDWDAAEGSHLTVLAIKAEGAE